MIFGIFPDLDCANYPDRTKYSLDSTHLCEKLFLGDIESWLRTNQFLIKTGQKLVVHQTLLLVFTAVSNTRIFKKQVISLQHCWQHVANISQVFQPTASAFATVLLAYLMEKGVIQQKTVYFCIKTTCLWSIFWCFPAIDFI